LLCVVGCCASGLQPEGWVIQLCCLCVSSGSMFAVPVRAPQTGRACEACLYRYLESICNRGSVGCPVQLTAVRPVGHRGKYTHSHSAVQSGFSNNKQCTFAAHIMADQPADLPFHSASASPEELAKAIWEAGKESIADKLGTFDNSLVVTNKVIKEGARGLEHSNDKFAPEAQVTHAATSQQLCAGGGASRPCTALLQSWAVSMQAARRRLACNAMSFQV
jgi:hypothetical protein